MSRLSPIDPSAFSPEEHAAYEELGRVPHNPRGPTAIWSRNPLLAKAALPLGNYLRFESKLSADLRELAILTTARQLNSQNEWSSHRPLAEKAGLEPSVLDDIAHRRKPKFSSALHEIVYDVAAELASTHDLRDATYRKAVNVLGERRLIDIITTVGFYTMLSLLLRSTRAPLPDGVVPPLPE